MNAGQEIEIAELADSAGGAEVEIRVSRSDLLERWSRCGATANYLASFLVADPSAQVLCSTVFNEIVENAAKYAASGDTTIGLRAWRREREVGIEARHLAEHDQVERLTSWVARIREEELDTLIERTAAAAEHSSRLGLLTLLRDYDARLSVQVAPYVGGGRREVAVRLVLPLAATGSAA